MKGILATLTVIAVILTAMQSLTATAVLILGVIIVVAVVETGNEDLDDPMV
jgi:di/tricarboxylate transporter